jgi:hypothetical protein
LPHASRLLDYASRGLIVKRKEQRAAFFVHLGGAAALSDDGDRPVDRQDLTRNHRLAGLVGALMLSRAVDDPKLSDDILETATATFGRS